MDLEIPNSFELERMLAMSHSASPVFFQYHGSSNNTTPTSVGTTAAKQRKTRAISESIDFSQRSSIPVCTGKMRTTPGSVGTKQNQITCKGFEASIKKAKSISTPACRPGQTMKKKTGYTRRPDQASRESSLIGMVDRVSKNCPPDRRNAKTNNSP
mmetsp:Transcript_39964/g.86245  ORF Transcript_39964/g.86245 Transcript_39964/m.86245 type:complete len:156 (-) Transcript_39964:311-778(-)